MWKSSHIQVYLAWNLLDLRKISNLYIFTWKTRNTAPTLFSYWHFTLKNLILSQIDDIIWFSLLCLLLFVYRIQFLAKIKMEQWKKIYFFLKKPIEIAIVHIFHIKIEQSQGRKFLSKWLSYISLGKFM